MRSKASRWALVGSASMGTVAWAPVNRTWLRVRVARWASSRGSCGRGAGRVVLAGGLGLGGGGAAGGRDRIAWLRRVLIGEGQQRPGAAQVPGQVAGEHADQHVCLDAFFQPVEHRPQIQVVGLDRAEVPLDVLEVLVGTDDAGGVEVAGGTGVRSTQNPSRPASASIWSCLRATARLVPVMVQAEVLAGLVLADHLAHLDPDSRGTGQARTRATSGASSSSVAASRSSRLRARSRPAPGCGRRSAARRGNHQR